MSKKKGDTIDRNDCLGFAAGLLLDASRYARKKKDVSGLLKIQKAWVSLGTELLEPAREHVHEVKESSPIGFTTQLSEEGIDVYEEEENE